MRLAQSEAKITIANSVRTSAEVDLRNHRLLALQMPAAWDAADIAFTSAGVAADGTRSPSPEVFATVIDSAAGAITVKAAAGQYVVLTTAHRDALSGLGRTKLVASADQAADRRITLIVETRDGNT